LRVDLRLGERVEVGGRGLEQRYPGRRHVVRVVQLARLRLVERVRPAVAELLERERDRPAQVRRVGEYGSRRLQRRDRQRQYALERRGVDGDRRGRYALTRDLLGDEAAERVPDNGRFGGQLGNGGEIVVGDLLDHLAGEHRRVAPGLRHRLRVVGPDRRERRVPGLLEECPPPVPSA